MNANQLPQPLKTIAEDGVITPNEVITIRKAIFGDHLVDQNEVQVLLALDTAVSDKCREWSDFFGEVMVDFAVNQAKPEGHISDQNAQWLIDNISQDGFINSREQLEMLAKVLDKAAAAPQFLMDFALKQVSKAVLENQGPVAVGRDSQPRVICSQDVEVIRKLMFAFGGEGSMAVTQTEAEFLFDLNDATLEYENDPSWSDLFVRAIGNHMLATMGNAVPDRNASLEQDEWLEGTNFFDKMVNSLRSAFSETKRLGDVVETNTGAHNDHFEQGLKTASAITFNEASWVTERIGRDGTFHENEKALLRFISEESNNLHPTLQELVDKAA